MFLHESVIEQGEENILHMNSSLMGTLLHCTALFKTWTVHTLNYCDKYTLACKDVSNLLHDEREESKVTWIPHMAQNNLIKSHEE